MPGPILSFVLRPSPRVSPSPTNLDSLGVSAIVPYGGRCGPRWALLVGGGKRSKGVEERGPGWSAPGRSSNVWIPERRARTAPLYETSCVVAVWGFFGLIQRAQTAGLGQGLEVCGEKLRGDLSAAFRGALSTYRETHIQLPQLLAAQFKTTSTPGGCG